MSNSFFSKNTEDKIKTVLRTFMENVLKRRLIADLYKIQVGSLEGF